MPKRDSKTPLRIAFFAPHDFEYVQRLTEGILRYQTDRGGCTIRDFRYDTKAPEDQAAWAKRARPWESWRPDGLIVNISSDPGLAQWIADSGIPAVNTSSNATPFPTVHLSVDGIARTAIEHFDSLGFAHFAYVACDRDDRRAEAFERALKRRRIGLRTINFQSNPAHWDVELESQLASSNDMCGMLREAPKPLAILASNDYVGRVTCQATRQMGFQIPGEVGILGINNHSICRTCDPPLSSIDGPGEDVSFAAMEILVDLIHGRRVPARTEVQPGKVYIRESTVADRGKDADLQYAMRMIRDRACEGLSMEQIVAETNMSRSTLHRRFLATIGRTPSEEIIRVRVQRAMELLARTDVSITRLAGMFGYESAGNFTSFIQAQTGMTPRDYRKKHRAE